MTWSTFAHMRTAECLLDSQPVSHSLSHSRGLLGAAIRPQGIGDQPHLGEPPAITA